MRRTVGVVIPLYNAESTITGALESVYEQQPQPDSIVVVDDGSTDDSASIVQQFAVAYVYQDNRGPSAARNSGLNLTKTDFIAFLDADDRWLPDALNILTSHLEVHTDVDAAQGQIRDVWPGKPPEVPRLSYNIGSALFRRLALQLVGGFDESLRRGEDIDLWMRWRSAELSRHTIQQPVMLYTRKPDPNPIRKQDHYARLLRAVKRSIDRTEGTE